MANKESLMTSILQYAMEGKLVVQNEEDSSSKDFLEKLLASKHRRFNEIVFEDGKYFEINKNSKKDISDEISVIIPSTWTYIRLSDLADNIEAGGTPSRHVNSYWEHGDIPWVKIGDIQGKYVTKTSEFITKEGLENSSAKIFPKGTILYSIFASIGTTAFLGIDASTNQAIAGLFFDESLNKEFIYYFLKNSAAYMLRQSHGTAQNNINQKILKNMIIPFPPIEEQERIVAKIKLLEPLVEEYNELEREREYLDVKLPLRLLKSVIKFNFGPSNYSNPGEWKTVKLSDIGTIVGGGTPDTNTIRYWENGNIEWVTPADMNSNLNYHIPSSRRKITQEGLDESSAKLMPPGAIIMSSRAPIGYLGINTIPTCTSQGCKSLVIKDEKKYLNKFIYFCIYNAIPDILDSASNMTFKEISGSKFGETQISVPPYKMQEEIVLKTEKLIHEIYTING